jgi:putative membrane protein
MTMIDVAAIVYLLACVWLFLRLMADEGRGTVARHRSLVTMSFPVVALPLMLGGCDLAESTPKEATFGNAARGAELIKQNGCGGCHIIPGIRRADGLVGPPLNHMGKRVYIAGLLRNTPANMIRWLRDPQGVVPGNAMPDMGLSEDQARDIAAYLSTLE